MSDRIKPGERFGHVVAIRLVEECRADRERDIWEFKCDCGRVYQVQAYNFIKSNSPAKRCRKCANKLFAQKIEKSYTEHERRKRMLAAKKKLGLE